MESANAGTKTKNVLPWVGRVLSALPILGMTGSAVMKLTRNPELITNLDQTFGLKAETVFAIGILELTCVLVYAIPRTSVLGAVLLTGYLGGAVATHVRVSDPFIAPLLFGVLVWVGLFLREERLRALLPLRDQRTS